MHKMITENDLEIYIFSLEEIEWLSKMKIGHFHMVHTDGD